jgi:hypothetical protein
MMLWLGLFTGASVGAGIVIHRLNTRRLMARYGEAFCAYNNAAFAPIVEPSPQEHFEHVTRLASEIISENGQRAIYVQPLGTGVAIHHINKDGTFSAKGPYFISWRTRNWRLTTTTHLVKVMRGQGGWGFKPDHYKQTGIIRERGIAILEYATAKHAPLSIREFAARQ